ncbi:hypothetical protein RHS01_01329 [Rhizoctonia solani]|uniref:Uncharacterized protein n=1 Tax=Rhizoctonia solani TaxID=456999 RepID=A0A8H7ILW0_9AGAM|nr:hypothetical protein RHS01_01329 [Rhizoctonia solani]
MICASRDSSTVSVPSLGNLDDIEKAIECGNRSLDLITEEHPGMAYRLNCLGNYYDDRHRRLGHLDDLTKSFEYRGFHTVERYRQVGDVADWRKRSNTPRALALTPDGHPGCHRHATLERRTQTISTDGDITDLEKATNDSRALALTPTATLTCQTAMAI